jgi:hypothetical protein
LEPYNRPSSNQTVGTDPGIRRKQKKARRAGQMDMFDDFDPEQYQLAPDFRRQLKARIMAFVPDPDPAGIHAASFGRNTLRRPCV